VPILLTGAKKRTFRSHTIEWWRMPGAFARTPLTSCGAVRYGLDTKQLAPTETVSVVTQPLRSSCMDGLDSSSYMDGLDSSFRMDGLDSSFCMDGLDSSIMDAAPVRTAAIQTAPMRRALIQTAPHRAAASMWTAPMWTGQLLYRQLICIQLPCGAPLREVLG
jgi:hypothetical protein